MRVIEFRFVCVHCHKRHTHARTAPHPLPPILELDACVHPAEPVKLKSKQEEIFEVEKEVAFRSVTVKNMVEDTGFDTPVPLPMVDSKILIKVIEYCKYHHKVCSWLMSAIHAHTGGTLSAFNGVFPFFASG